MTGTKEQDRLDRLEKMAEAMFPAIAELKAPQAIYAEDTNARDERTKGR